MKKHKKVSVITPTYNRMEFLPDCIASVMDQDWPNLEYIIIDGGSTDGTREYIKRINKKLKRKIRYYNYSDLGVAKARNAGIRKSTGEFVCFIDSDDILLPGSIRMRANFLTKNPDANFVYGKRYVLERSIPGAWSLSKNKKFLGDHPAFNKLKTKEGQLKYALTHIAAPPGCTVMMRKKAFKKTGVFDSKLKTADTTEFYFRIMTKDKFYYLDKYFYAIRRDPSIDRVSLPKKEFMKFLNKEILPRFKNYEEA